MSPGDVHEPIRDHIRAIDGRSAQDAALLAWRLHGGCWPEGGADQAPPPADDFTRRWSPRPVAMPVFVCLCADGPCPICN